MYLYKILKYYYKLPFCPFRKNSLLLISRWCLSSVDIIPVYHMLIVYHVSAVITYMFYSNCIPVKYD